MQTAHGASDEAVTLLGPAAAVHPVAKQAGVAADGVTASAAQRHQCPLCHFPPAVAAAAAALVLVAEVAEERVCSTNAAAAAGHTARHGASLLHSLSPAVPETARELSRGV